MPHKKKIMTSNGLGNTHTQHVNKVLEASQNVKYANRDFVHTMCYIEQC